METAKSCFGLNSLSSLHAAYLLSNSYDNTTSFYSPPEAARLIADFHDIFANLYSGSNTAKGPSIEGLQMGIILWAQGALEETVAVLIAFENLAARELGETDALTKKVGRAAGLAREEWEREQGRKERSGRDVLRCGTCMFPRGMDELAALVG